MPYASFDSDLERGQIAENLVRDYYSDKFDDIRKASLSEEIENGYDFVFTHNDKEITVEVKNDDKSAVTGNVFIELSVIKLNTGVETQGWALKTKADIIMIYAGNGLNKGLYLIKLKQLRLGIEKWKDEFIIRETMISQSANSRWKAKGICVPLLEFSRYCFKFIPDRELRG